MTAPEDQQAAFLAAIRDDPDDDAARLVFADWLEDHGDSARAELIRIQCALADLEQDDPSREELQRREGDLLFQHGADWRDSPPPDVQVAFRRGLASVQVKAQALSTDAVSQWLLARRSWVSEMRVSGGDDELLRDAIARGLFAQVVALSFLYDRLTDDGLQHLAGLTQLRELKLMCRRVTSKGLKHLSGLTRLRKLSLTGRQLKDAGLKHLAWLTQLQELDLDGTAVTGTGLKHLAGLAQLEALSLEGTAVTDATLKHLAGLTHLEDLSLEDTRVTDAALEHLAGLTRLQWLNLRGTGVTGAGLVHLAGLTELRGLVLLGAEVTDEGLEHLAGLTGLQALDLHATDVTDAGLEHLAGLTGLRKLSLSMTRVTDSGLKHLAGLTALRALNLSSTPVTDAGLAHLAGLTGLQQLSLHLNRVTDAGLTCLAGLTSLRVSGDHESNGLINGALRQFGLVPTDAALPCIRGLLEQELEGAGREDGRDDYLVLLYCVQLFSRARLEDVQRIWHAKKRDMDLDFTIDRQVLCGAGLEATKRFLASQEEDETAADVLEYLETWERDGGFSDFSPPAYLEHCRRYFGVE
jgi:uncharacterized protein (TIGR02996 family)